MKSHYVAVKGTPLGPVWFGAVVSIFFLVDGVDASLSRVAQKYRLEFWGSSIMADIYGLLIMLFKRTGDRIIENKNTMKCHITFCSISRQIRNRSNWFLEWTKHRRVDIFWRYYVSLKVVYNVIRCIYNVRWRYLCRRYCHKENRFI